MRLGDAEQRFGRIGRNCESTREVRFGAGAIAPMQENIAELDRKLGHHRCSIEPARERLDRFVAMALREQDRTKLAPCRGKARMTFGRPPKTAQSVFRTARLPQRHRQYRIDLRVVLAARGIFEERNRVLRAALRQESTTQNVQSTSVTRIGTEQ